MMGDGQMPDLTTGQLLGVVSGAVALLIFVFEWLGFKGNNDPIANPQALSDIWWHLPVMWLCFWVVFWIAHWIGEHQE